MYIRTSFVCSSLHVSSIRIYILITGFVDTKPLLASEWSSNFCSESQNHVLAMHIIAHFFPIFLNFQRSEDDKKRTGEEEEGQEVRAEGGVEVDEER